MHLLFCFQVYAACGFWKSVMDCRQKCLEIQFPFPEHQNGQTIGEYKVGNGPQ